jgi:hypothetical protein
MIRSISESVKAHLDASHQEHRRNLWNLLTYIHHLFALLGAFGIAPTLRSMLKLKFKR